jgi:hypothetical protein
LLGRNSWRRCLLGRNSWRRCRPFFLDRCNSRRWGVITPHGGLGASARLRPVHIVGVRRKGRPLEPGFRRAALRPANTWPSRCVYIGVRPGLVLFRVRIDAGASGGLACRGLGVRIYRSGVLRRPGRPRVSRRTRRAGVKRRTALAAMRLRRSGRPGRLLARSVVRSFCHNIGFFTYSRLQAPIFGWPLFPRPLIQSVPDAAPSRAPHALKQAC